MKSVLIAVGLVFVAASLAIAAVGVTSSGSAIGTATDLNFKGGLVASGAGSAIDVAVTGAIVDPALYTASKSTGVGRYLCINVDGTIYANAATCL